MRSWAIRSCAGWPRAGWCRAADVACPEEEDAEESAVAAGEEVD